MKSMRSVCGRAGISPEHDGIAAQGDPQLLLEACSKAVAPLRVAIKEYPGDPFQYFRLRFPQYTWDTKADCDVGEYWNLLTECRVYIGNGVGAVGNNRNSFAKLVADRRIASLPPSSALGSVLPSRFEHI